MKMVILGLLLASSAFAADSIQEQNKKIVLDFYAIAFNQHHPLEAALKYLALSYIQHNPGVADGRAGFIAAFPESEKPDLSVTDFKRVIAEGDLVVVHSNGHNVPGDLGYAVVDIFRVNNGIITEHWDVGQKVPATSKNNNTMF